MYQRKRQSDMQQQQIRQFEFDQAMQQAEMQRRQMQSAPEYANNLFQAMGRLPRRGPLSPPPMAQQQPTPQPGEASVPMTQGGPSQTQPPVPMPPSQSDPERAYLSGQPTDQDVETPQKALQRAMGDKQALTRDMMRYRNAGPDQKGIFYQEMKKIDSAIVRLSGQGGMVSAGGDVPQGVPPGGGMMKTGMQQGQPQAQPTSPPIAPYRSMDSVGQAAPQGPSLVPNPPPPPIPQGQPEPQRNSLSIQDAIEVIKGMNIKDPMMRMRVLEGMKPYLTDEAKQEAAMLRGQHQQSQPIRGGPARINRGCARRRKQRVRSTGRGGNREVVHRQPPKREPVDRERVGAIAAIGLGIARSRAVAHQIEVAGVLVRARGVAAVWQPKGVANLVLGEIHCRNTSPIRVEVGCADVQRALCLSRWTERAHARRSFAAPAAGLGFEMFGVCHHHHRPGVGRAGINGALNTLIVSFVV